GGPGAWAPFVRRHEDVVMRYGRLELEEELLVFRIVHGTLRIRACEAADRIERFPECDQEEMSHIPVRSPEDNPALVAWRVAVLLESGVLEHLEVRIGLRCRRHSVPRPRDHETPASRNASRGEEAAAGERRASPIGMDRRVG